MSGKRPPISRSRIGRPPPFIALIGPEGVKGYVRADRIETIVLHYLDTTHVWGARIIMFNGSKLFTRETPDEVFAKMADALHANSLTGTNEPLHYPTSDAHSRTLCDLSLTEKFTQTPFFTTDPDAVTCSGCAYVIRKRRGER